MTHIVRDFAKRLQTEFPNIEIVYQDERYSTLDASANLHEKGQNAKRQHKTIDRTAACVILERYLRSINQIGMFGF
jgi:putative Holliday junction resolvase